MVIKIRYSKTKSMNIMFQHPSKHLLVQTQQYKLKKKSVKYAHDKVNNEDTRRKSVTSFWCLYR